MQMTYDDVSGAVYVYFDRVPVARTVRVSKNTLIDYDADGNIVGVEFISTEQGVDLSEIGAMPNRAEVERLLSERAFRVLTA